MYQKLFPISYNNKKFMIFLDEKNQKTFLEINEAGEYVYPNLEDYIELYKIYNLKDPFICCEVGKFTFKNKVKVIKNGILSVLTVITIINSMPGAKALDVKTSDDSVTITEEEPSYRINPNVPITYYCPIHDVKDLDKYLGEVNVTKELVMEAIDNNKNLTDNIKQAAKDMVNALTNKYPNINLRVFYENIKSLNIKVHTNEEYESEFSYMPGAGAHYSTNTNTIHLRNSSDYTTICHELCHTFYHIYREVNNNMVLRTEVNNALDEGMTDIMVEANTPPHSHGAYLTSKQVLELFMDYARFSYEEYNEHGMSYLINKAQKLYPDIDFNYISQALNVMKDTEIYKDKVAQIDDSMDMYDEIFKVCLKNATKENGYQPFLKFIKLLERSKDSNLKIKYLEKYNVELQKNGGKIISVNEIKSVLKKWNRANGLALNPNVGSFSLMPIRQDNYALYIVSPEGTPQVEAKNYMSIPFDNFELQLFYSYLENKESYGASTFWEKMAIESGVSKNALHKTSIYMGDTLISNEMTSTLAIRVGVTKDNRVGFVIQKFNEVFYQSDSEMDYVSTPVSLLYYINEREISDIHLEKYLNYEFLLNRIKERNIFNNVAVKDNQLVFLPPVPTIPEIVESAETVEPPIPEVVEGESKWMGR